MRGRAPASESSGPHLEPDPGALGVHVGLRRVDRRAGRGQEAGAGHGGAGRHGELALAAAGEAEAVGAVGAGGGRGVRRGGGEDGGGDGGVGEAEAVAEAGDVPRVADCPLLRRRGSDGRGRYSPGCAWQTRGTGLDGMSGPVRPGTERSRATRPTSILRKSVRPYQAALPPISVGLLFNALAPVDLRSVFAKSVPPGGVRQLGIVGSGAWSHPVVIVPASRFPTFLLLVDVKRVIWRSIA